MSRDGAESSRGFKSKPPASTASICNNNTDLPVYYLLLTLLQGPDLPGTPLKGAIPVAHEATPSRC